MSETPVNERPIGVFDSGLGGLTVLRALIDLLPNERTIYFGDTGHFPYGAKPLEDVLKYSLGITDLLLERDVKAIVIACNNAAAAALETLDERLDIPVMGVIEPGLRAGAKATRSGRLGVIATAGTVASGAYQQLAARSPGSITPITGTGSRASSTSRAAAAALLHATTTARAPRSTRRSPISSAYFRTSSRGLGPYGNRPESPK